MKKVKNLKLRTAAYLLASGIVLGSNPMIVNAEEASYDYENNYEENNYEENDYVENNNENDYEKEDLNNQANSEEEEVVYSQVEDEHEEETQNPSEEEKREYGSDEFIDGDNWSPDKDKDPSAGVEIPDTVETEKERKKLKPSKPHKSSDDKTTVEPEATPVPKTADNYLNLFLLPTACYLIYWAFKKVHIVLNDVIEGIYEEDSLDTEPQQVIGSRKKGKKGIKFKKLK